MKFILSMAAIFALTTKILCEQNYIVDNENIEAMEGDGDTLFIFSELKCIRRERAINGSVTVVEDLDDEAFKLSIAIYSSSSGNRDFRKVGMDVPKTGTCEAFKKFYRQFVQPSLVLGENTNLPEVPDEGLCPFPKGTYYIKELALNTEKWPTHIPHGTVKVVISFFKNDAFVGGVTVYIKVQSR